jgi:plastocyanin
MDDTKKIISVVVIVIVIAIIAVVWYRYPSGPVISGTPGSGTGVASSSTTPASTSASSTRAPVPANITVPNQGATGTPASVAVPTAQVAGDPSGSVSYRSFNISIQNNAFSPNTVVVNQGDTVNLEVTAVDAAYTFTQPDYGFNSPIAKGKTQRIQFQALENGQFTFYCGSCGGPSKGPVGHLIIVAPK